MDTTSLPDRSRFPLIDSHAHLDEVEDIDRALLRAREKGVAAVVGVGMDSASNRRILEIAAAHPGLVYPAVGLHPWNLDPRTVEDELAELEKLLPSCAALGEVGLDYKAKAPKPLQKETFRRLLELAGGLDKPVIIHCRYSHQRAVDMAVEAGIRRAVFHWYAGPPNLLDRIVERGWFISATPALSYSPSHQEAVRGIPLENLLLETDCPVRYGDLDSRPEHLLTTLTLAAEVKGLDPETVARVSTANGDLYTNPLTIFRNTWH